MTEISEMTPEELRIKCAEKCRWRRDTDINVEKYGESKIWEELYTNGKVTRVGLPDYERFNNDLHELIEAVPEDKRSGFIDALIHNLDLDLQMFDSALEGNSWKGNVPKDLFTLLAADPLAIMRAFLEVMK
jgi:hypothetical protein